MDQKETANPQLGFNQLLSGIMPFSKSEEQSTEYRIVQLEALLSK